MKEATLCLLIRKAEAGAILLGLKKKGFGAGKYVGFGGKIEDGESVLAAAMREVREETGLRVSEEDLEPVAELWFRFPARPEWNHRVHVFVAQRWQGSPQESPEMKPAWFALDELPWAQMWDDTAYWLPLVLAGQHLRVSFIYGSDNATVEHWNIETD